jgi:hypothetical protein
MMNNFFEQLKANIKVLNKEYVKTVFTIATTSKQESYPYLTPIRKTSYFITCGCIIFEKSTLTKVLDIVDGSVDFVFIDSEKKILDKSCHGLNDKKNLKNFNKKFVETEFLFEMSFKKIKISKVFEYKPNDITVNATWSFLSQKFKILRGKKISILGCGNIGSKLALKLSECGAILSINRQNNTKGSRISEGLNCIKPEDKLSNITYQDNILQAAFNCDVVIGTSNGISIIDSDILKAIRKNALIIDLGKNTLTKEAIEYAHNQNLEIYRTDVTSALEGFIHEALKMNEILNQSYGKRTLGFCSIISGGYFGSNGDIVVDNLIHPSKVLGVAAGDGTMKKQFSTEDLNKITKFSKKFM